MSKSNNKKPKTTPFKKLVTFIKQHKKGSLIALGVVLVLISIPIIKNVIEVIIEENRNYYISIEDEYTFDCNASYDEDEKYLYCEEREITGDYSDYETIYLGGASERKNGKFERSIQRIFYKSDYETENKLNFAKIEKNLTLDSEIFIRNERLEKHVLDKEFTVNFHLTDADKELLKKKQNDWREWKATEEKAKAEREAAEAAKAAEEKQQKDTESKKAEDTSTSSGSSSSNSSWKEVLSGYEAWVDGYVDFMKKYKNANASDMAAMMNDYTKLLNQQTEWTEKINNLRGELSGSDLAEYLNTLARVNQKLSELY